MIYSFGRLTQLGECLLDVEKVTGSSPVSSTTLWGYSSVGRALEWHSRGHVFDSRYLHQKAQIEFSVWAFLLSFFVYLKTFFNKVQAVDN